jgi:3D (Asp-Asp-Asp) domain-containing protein
MVRRFSVKLGALGLVIATLITAFSISAPVVPVSLAITPRIILLVKPRSPSVTSRYKTYGPDPNPSLILKATGYNSAVNQTDTTPFTTATGARTRWGIIAVSRDLLEQSIPYGSLVRIHDLGGYRNGRGHGRFQGLLDEQRLFIVEDTMHRRKRQQIDVWFPEYQQAMQWGVRKVEVEVVRYGRHGPVLDDVKQAQPFNVVPRLQASRQFISRQFISQSRH